MLPFGAAVDDRAALPSSSSSSSSSSSLLAKNGRRHKKDRQKRRAPKHLLFRPAYLWGLHAYVLRQSGAAKLTRSLPIDAPVDCFVSKLALEGIHLKALALVRPIAFQNRELKSDIAHSGMLRHGFGGGGGSSSSSSNGGSL